MLAKLESLRFLELQYIRKKAHRMVTIADETSPVDRVNEMSAKPARHPRQKQERAALQCIGV